MKSVYSLLTTALVGLLIQCCSAQVSLAPAKPDSTGSNSMTYRGELLLFSNLAGRSEGNNSAWSQSTNFGIYNLRGKLAKHVDNTIGHNEKPPRRAALPAGINLVIARAKDDFSSPGIQIGDSHLVLGGPLVAVLLPRRSGAGASLGRNILDLPVIRLIVPERLPLFPEDDPNYSAWEEQSSRPWAAIATGTPAGDNFINFFNNGPQNGFISLGW
jgi:hypothetical protein